MGTFAFILGTILAIFVWSTYHKLFNIAYFGFEGFIKEIIAIEVVCVALVTAIFGY